VRVYSFPAVVANDARILILGSMPGVASLHAHQYYAHPRNQFWSLLQQLSDAATTTPYEARLRLLRSRHLALWDVLHSCVRCGSLDAAIEHRSARPNDLPGLLRATPSIDRICCNGGTAHAALKRYFGETLAREFPQIEVHLLPSTSPANASWSFARKLHAWRKALQPALDMPAAP
jgi:TDG/mug DNA glycosylase family protein